MKRSFINQENIKNFTKNVDTKKEIHKKYYNLTITDIIEINHTIDNKKVEKQIKNYLNNKFNIYLHNKNIFDKIKNPKISIVITVYNQEDFINKFMLAFQTNL